MSEFKFDKFSRRSFVAKPQPNLSHRKLKIYKFSPSSAKCVINAAVYRDQTRALTQSAMPKTANLKTNLTPRLAKSK